MNTKKFMKSLLILIVSICVYSCTQEKTNKANDFPKFKADITSINDVIEYNDIVLDTKYIKLKTTNDALISEIKKILFADNKIFILANNVFCYDMNGDLLFKLDKRGRGPKEFIRLDDISISNNKLYLYDNSQWKILSFDIEQGRFIKSYNLPYSIPRLEVIGENTIVDRFNFPNKYLRDKERVFISSLEKPKHISAAYFSEQEYSQVQTEFQFTGYNGVAYLSNPFRGKVYKIQVDSVENYFQVKGDKMMTDNDIELFLKQNTYSTDAISASGKAYGFERFFETSNFISCDFFIGDKKAYLVYDKNTGKNRVFCDVKRDYYQYPPVEFIGVYDDYFCKIINSETIVLNNSVYLSDHKIDDLKLKTDSTYRIINTVSSEDNPIIALYKFKNIN